MTGAGSAPEIALCIASYNEAEWLARMLGSLRAGGSPGGIEVVVGDSASTDGTARLLRRRFRWVRCVVTPFNGGYSTALNAAIRASAAPFAVAANADLELAPAALYTLREALLADPEAFGAVPRLLNSDGTPQGSLDHFPTLAGVLQTALRGSPVPPAVPAEGAPFPIETGTGACVMYRREWLEQVGLLDERFFLYFEEADLHYRLRQKAGHLLAVPRAVVTHHGGKSTGGRTLRNVQQHLVSLFYFMQKHHGPAAETAVRVAMAGGYAGRAVLSALNELVRAASAVAPGEPMAEQGRLRWSPTEYAALLWTCVRMWRETERGVEPRARALTP